LTPVDTSIPLKKPPPPQQQQSQEKLSELEKRQEEKPLPKVPASDPFIITSPAKPKEESKDGTKVKPKEEPKKEELVAPVEKKEAELPKETEEDPPKTANDPVIKKEEPKNDNEIKEAEIKRERKEENQETKPKEPVPEKKPESLKEEPKLSASPVSTPLSVSQKTPTARDDVLNDLTGFKEKFEWLEAEEQRLLSKMTGAHSQVIQVTAQILIHHLHSPFSFFLANNDYY
jgi:hypothetical protein